MKRNPFVEVANVLKILYESEGFADSELGRLFYLYEFDYAIFVRDFNVSIDCLRS